MDARHFLLKSVRESFVGPRNGTDEALPPPNTPLDMYSAGILFPKNTQFADTDSESNDDAATDEPSNDRESPAFLKQNSIGLRTKVTGTDTIGLSINYGKYAQDSDGVWRRHDLDCSKREHKINLAKKRDSVDILDGDGNRESRVSWIIQDSVLSVFLENNAVWVDRAGGMTSSDASRLNNTNTIFQPFISLHAVGPTSPFLPITTQPVPDDSQEDELFDMLYRDRRVFGSGYCCAAAWEGENPMSVRTEIMPIYKDRKIGKFAAPGDTGRPKQVDMHELSCFDNDGDWNACRRVIRERLVTLVDEYGEWIRDHKHKIDTDLEDEYQGVATRNMQECDAVIARMRDGLALLTDERGDDADMIVKAFVLANRAMLYQRLHFKYALGRFKGGQDLKWPNPRKPAQAFWYPFQIAFVLMSLRGIAFDQHKDRSIADLIWFPTGGGKTEAYMGVAAFAILLRRLRRREENGLGVSVIMRYTLRLLTLQQFERASTLICALEHIRRISDSGLGDEPFLLGLWVGHSLTPNHYKGSKDALYALHDDPNASTPDGSPCQVNYCPWCGHRLLPSPNYRFDQNTKWTIISCTNKGSKCRFAGKTSPREALPLVTVDSDIYTRCPSLLIATVDKFARMPFRADIANIFGGAARRCDTHGFLTRGKHGNCTVEGTGKHRNGEAVHNVHGRFPPDLIIQDELHLIAGPLGTMVGLYEAAVDFLTRVRRGAQDLRPKIIVSTATSKGVAEQVRRIFDRERTQSFPPPGTDGGDSFFWWRESGEGKFFAGLSFSHRSGKYALAKLYAVLLQGAQAARRSHQIPDLDPYWTLVGYFNSIRELGGANRLVEDDVVRYIDFLAQTVRSASNTQARQLGAPENGIEELTSRKTQREINVIRDKLERPLQSSSEPISVLLATNMISVGLDIDRLALMVVNGQPKAVTEYIQATGRIGRRSNAPGCVFTLFNPHKPRDLSHYEDFAGFHRTMQKYIEPSTLTPFSVPAYERALHAVLIAMIRLGNPRLSENKDAARFRVVDGQEAAAFLLQRFQSVEGARKDSDSYRRFEGRLILLLEEWEKFANEGYRDPKNLVQYNAPYNKWKQSKTNKNVLMVEFAKADSDGSDKFPLPTPESLRDVERYVDLAYEDGAITMTDKEHFQIRPSQVTRTFGPGSIYDNQRDSMVVMGLEYWNPSKFRPIRDELLLRQIRNKLQNIDRLVSMSSPEDGESPGKVQVRSFPTWGFCSRCHKLVRGRDYGVRAGIRCDSEMCAGRERETGGPKTYPVRFVAACQNGHLDEFPWYEWVHRTPEQRHACSRDRANLYLETDPRYISAASSTVGCRNCDAPQQSLGSAMSKNGLRSVTPGCTRRRPWLGDREAICQDADGGPVQMKGMFKGSTNMYFPLPQSAITIPPFSDDLAEKISAEGAEIQKFRQESSDFNGWLITKFDLESPARPAARWTLKDALQKISDLEDFSKNEEIDVRQLEFGALSSKHDSNDKEFVTENISAIPTRMLDNHMVSAVVVKRARVVSALPGFTRLDPPDPRSGQRIAHLTRGRLDWLPVVENKCEGIFLSFDSAALDTWEGGHDVAYRFGQIAASLGDPPADQGRYRAKYVFLHTLSHLTMKLLAKAAGYSLASFTERIYCGDGMAGILIFTSSPSSDGALGGMAELGRGDYPKIWPIIRNAISEASRCSCDPLCASRDPSKTLRPLGAACHACVLLPETCCENANTLLDRTMVQETVNSEMGFLTP